MASWTLRGAAKRVWNYLFFERNPIVQILYVVLMLYLEYAFVVEAHPYLPNSYVGEHHKWITLALYLSAFGLFIYMSCSDPGVITPENVDQFRKYPHHPVLFPEQKFCRTCKTPKLPRSKHCRACNHCVARFDHHCIWFSSCVGVHNYGAFILFLLAQLAVALEAFYVSTSVFFTQALDIVKDDSDEEFRKALQFVIATNQQLGVVAAMGLMVAIVLWVFLLVQLRRIALNITAAESFKRDALHMQADPDNASGARRLFNMLVSSLPDTQAELSRADQKKNLDSSWGGLFSPDTILNTEERFTAADVDFNPYHLGGFLRNFADAFQGRAARKSTSTLAQKKLE